MAHCAADTVVWWPRIRALCCWPPSRSYSGCVDAQSPRLRAVPRLRPRIRDVQIDKVLRESGVEAWVRDTRGTAPTGIMYPRLQGYIATARSNIHVDAGGGVPLCRHRQGEQQQASHRLKNACYVALHEAQGYGTHVESVQLAGSSLVTGPHQEGGPQGIQAEQGQGMPVVLLVAPSRP